MQLNLKKASIRQVAAISSLVIIALALPIGVYLTQQTQNLQKLATNSPITPPTNPTPTPSSYNNKTHLKLISEPSSIINMSVSSNGGHGINAVPINTNTYEVETDLSDMYFVWGTYGNIGFFNLNDYALCGYNIPQDKCSNMHADITANAPGKAIIYATAFDVSTQTAIATTYWVLNVTETTSPSPSPYPSPSPTLVNKFDINEDGQINILDYAAFITGFIAGLSQ